MRRIIWTTDIHLNFLSPTAVETFLESIGAARPDAVLVGGDIAEADSIERYLCLMDDALDVPVYFVLGNHDFYRGSIAEVRQRAAGFSGSSRRTRWLPAAGVVEISPRSALVGHDGFYDARLGDFEHTRVMLSDFLHIDELRIPYREERNATLAGLADEAAAYLRAVVSEAFEHYEQVVVLTHVPPFREASWHEGKPSEDDFLPYFASRASGDALAELAQAHPDRTLLVLCGHTHGCGYVRVLPNLEVYTGRAEYGAPELQPLLEVGEDRLVYVAREGWASDVSRS